MTISIVHRGLELTPAIRSYVEEKMLSLDKYYEGIRHLDVDVGLANGHHNKGNIFFCKVVVHTGGEPMPLEREAEDLYKAIDKVRDHLRVELAELNKREREAAQGRG